MINNAYAKLNRTIKRDIAKKVKELIKENKNNEYYELYVIYDKVNNCELLSTLEVGEFRTFMLKFLKILNQL